LLPALFVAAFLGADFFAADFFAAFLGAAFLADFFLGTFAPSSCFRQPYRNCLFTAGYFFTAAATLKLSTLFFMHGLFNFFAGLFRIFRHIEMFGLNTSNFLPVIET
jgi:hypothetical protein